MSYRLKITALWLAITFTACNTGTEPPSTQNPPTPVLTAPAAPSSLAATAMSPTRVDLTWTDNASNEDGFRIERCQGAACTTFSEIASYGTPNRTSHTDLTGAPATTYRYRVLAYNASGVSQPSALVGVTTQTPTPPAAPSGLVAAATSSTNVTLTWTDNASNENGFTVERCQGTGCTAFAAIGGTSANGTTYHDTGLAAGGTYRYRVKAYGVGESGYAGPVAVTTPAPPAAPSNLVATVVSSSRIDLSWTDNANNESGFELERCSGAGCSSFTLLTSPGANATTYSNTGLSASTSYSYRIRALHPTAGPSSYSATATAVTQPQQASPVISVSVTSRTFTATAGGANPASQQAQVGNAGGGQLTGLTLSENPPAAWLTVGLSSTTAPATITFQVTTGTLAAGTYTTAVHVTSPVASNSPQIVQVTFTVAAPATRQVTIVNNMSTSLNIHDVVQFKVRSPTGTFGGADMLTPDPASCVSLPGESIPPGGSRTFTITTGNNYSVFLGIGIWDIDSFTCPTSAPFFKRRFFTDTNYNLWYVYRTIDVTGHTGGNWIWRISGSYLNGTLAVTPDGGSPIQFAVSQTNPIP